MDINLSYGQMNEEGNYLFGGRSNGLFSNSGNIKTNFLKLQNKKKLFGNLYFISSYISGRTNLSGNDYGIFRNYSNVKVRGYSIGIFNENFLGGNLSIHYSEPLRIYDGSVDINIPIARDNAGNVQRLAVNQVSLRPEGREKDLEISYNIAKDNYNLNIHLIAIEEPMNFRENDNEYLGIIKYRLFF